MTAKRPSMKREKNSAAIHLRAKLWVEVEGAPSTALTDAGADLLEQIEVCGSLSEAARRLRYAYRRAWMLVDAMNRAWKQPVVKAATGGKHGGGAQLTEFGRTLLAAYREVQLRVEHAIDEASLEFRRTTSTKRSHQK